MGEEGERPMSSIFNLRQAQIKALSQPSQAQVREYPLTTLLLHPMQQQKLKLPGNYQIMKRCIDIGGGLLGLLILLLLIPFIALFILCEDRGPIFYKQERIGLYGRPFQTYKLRSMVINADIYLAQHPELLQAWRRSGKLQNDPRITQIGKFLRRTSLDELPQVLNVLRGDMSLVGPRAIQATEIVAFGELGELRQMVKPGLTGLWQISGRSHTTYEQRALLDCTYVLECSIALDLSILIRTLPVVLHGEGAY
jgi:lipopolysaccharide/colanic/teichoic acid biosynthesis glycosyltransferase